ncbi:MAG: SemiSWEET transporter [DPANN group archaeon]|nr:SemiSWEET transporter [DPANN group archaeon]
MIGFIASILTTISFIPQIVTIYKTKDTKSISLKMYLLFCSGITLWLIYGLLKKDLPIILANSITLILSLIILSMKLKYK